MKPRFLKSFASDWNPTLTLWLPLFAGLMWYGITRHFEDLGLYAVAMALAALGVSSNTVVVVRKWQEWRRSKGGQGS